MEKDRFAKNDTRVLKLLADGLIAASAGRTKSGMIEADTPAFSILSYWTNKNTTYGGNFQDAITEYFNNIPSDNFDYFNSLYTYNYFGDPSFRMK